MIAESDRELAGIHTDRPNAFSNREAESDRELAGIDTKSHGAQMSTVAESDRELAGSRPSQILRRLAAPEDVRRAPNHRGNIVYFIEWRSGP